MVGRGVGRDGGHDRYVLGTWDLESDVAWMGVMSSVLIIADVGVV